MTVLIESLEKNFIRTLKEYNPDLVCFTVITGSHLWVYDLIKKIKKDLPNSLFVMGGPHPTFFPESIEKCAADIICIGEGEGAILDLANNFSNKENIKTIKNLQVKEKNEIFKNEVRPLIERLDSIPFPDRSVYYKYPILRDAERKIFFTSRGCPYNCSFCFNHKYRKIYDGKGKYIRTRSADNIIWEILEVKNKYGLKMVLFQDDTFILNKNWLRDFLKKYKEKIGLPFICAVRADLTDEETVGWLKEAGCVGVLFGIESGDEQIRNEILRKNLKDEEIINAAGLYKKYKIKFKTTNILGLPNEDLKDAFKTVELNIKIKTDLPWVSIFIPYPGTDIAETMREQKMIPDDYGIDDLSSTFFIRKTRNKNECVILNLQRMFFWAVKFPVIFPLVKKLIKLPPNFLFDFVFYLGHFYIYKLSENLNWKTSLRMGYNFFRINMLKEKK